MTRLVSRFMLFLLALVCVPAAADGKKEDRKRDRPAVLKRPDWGKVTGWIMDARTRRPIPGARIAVEIDGAFPDSGKGTAETDETGRFVARAPLGNVSSKFDWGRLLTMHPISLILSPKSVTKQTRILDVTQANVRVEAEGYKPFLGRVRATLVDAGRFTLTLDDVWLAPADAPLISFSPDNLRLEVVEGLELEPAIAEPGQKVKVRLTTRLPFERGYKYRAFATSSSIRIMGDPLELKRLKPRKGEPAPAEEDADRIVYTGELKLPKSSQDRWSEIGFFLVRNETTMLRHRATKALLQIVKTSEERAAAERVLEGFGHARLGDKEAALREYGAARRQRGEYALAHLLYGDLCLQLNRPGDAAEAYRQLVTLDERDYEVARSRYAQALLEAGQPAEALAQLADAEKVLGKRYMPPHVALGRARAHAAQGSFEEADKWLARAGALITIPDEIQAEINLKRMNAAVAAAPENADLRLSYARLLAGLQRREEAVSQIRKAAELDPSQPWPFIDLGEALWDLGRREESLGQLRHALKLAPENPEALLALADACRDLGRYDEALPLYGKVAEAQPLNLRARHNHALMLYATGAMEEARRELLAVVKQARDKGDLRESGLLIPGNSIYFGPKRRLVSGFSVPEAAADAAILEALQELQKHPENALLWQNIGSALLDLDLPGMALQALEKSRACDPDLLETRFFLGMAHRKLGRLDRALPELKTVVAANPLHPRARLELAAIYTDQGEPELAQAELIEHARNYPYQRPPRQTRSLGG